MPLLLSLFVIPWFSANILDIYCLRQLQTLTLDNSSRIGCVCFNERRTRKDVMYVDFGHSSRNPSQWTMHSFATPAPFWWQSPLAIGSVGHSFSLSSILIFLATTSAWSLSFSATWCPQKESWVSTCVRPDLASIHNYGTPPFPPSTSSSSTSSSSTLGQSRPTVGQA